MNFAQLPIDYFFYVFVGDEEVYSAASMQAFPTFAVGSKVWTKSFIEPGLGEPEGPFEIAHSDYLIVQEVRHAIQTTSDGRHQFSTTVVARDPLVD